jgi:hypothetical protein
VGIGSPFSSTPSYFFAYSYTFGEFYLSVSRLIISSLFAANCSYRVISYGTSFGGGFTSFGLGGFTFFSGFGFSGSSLIG